MAWLNVIALFFIVAPSVAIGVFLNWQWIKDVFPVFKYQVISRTRWRIKRVWSWCKRLWVGIKRNYVIIFVSALFVFFFIAFLLLFYFHLLPLIGLLYVAIENQAKDIQVDSDAFRNVSLSIGGSITLSFAVLGIILTVIRNILTRQQNNTDEQKLVTEQISRAIDQIGAYKQTANGAILEPNIEVRLGGLYSLQRIMQHSLKDEETIAKIFYAFVRQNTEKNITNPPKKNKKVQQPREDVQAVLDIISQFNTAWRKRGKHISRDMKINFSNINFSRYSFENMDFSDAILEDADLSYTESTCANFSGANLRHANLSFAKLLASDLSFVDFTLADLTSAELSSADLLETYFALADLSFASLDHVHNLTERQRSQFLSEDAAKKRRAYKKIRTTATKTKKPATKATKTKKPATKATKTKKPATKATKTQKPATKVNKTQKPTTKANKTQKPATKANKTQNSTTKD